LAKATSPAHPVAPSNSTTITGRAPVQVIVSKSRNNDMIVKIVKRNNQPCYTTHIETYLKNNPTFTKETLKVDKFTYLVDPGNIFSQFGSTNSNGYTRRILVLVHTMYGPKQFANNNAANRARWANAFVSFYNDPGTQAEMRYPELACFGGDVTPQDENNCAPLSHWLTAQDTVDYITSIQPNCSSFSDVLNNDDLMSIYFQPEDIPRVRARLNPNAQTPNHGNNNSFQLDF
jgi:hypothetical protein